MPRKITASGDLADIVLITDVPQDTESIDASDVVVPLQTLLNNDGFLYRRQNAIYDLFTKLQQSQSSLQLLSSLTSARLEPSRTYLFAGALRVARFGGLLGNVALTVLNAPAGVTVTATPNPITDVADLTIVTSAGIIAGNYDLILRGTAGAATADIRIPLVLVGQTQPASFDLTGPSGVAIDRPTSASATAIINVQRGGGFNSPIDFTADVPAGITATFTPTPVTGADSVQRAATTLTLTAGGTIPAGPYSITVRGASGSIVRTLSLRLDVSAPAPVGGTPSYALRMVYDDGDPYTVNGATLFIDRSGGFAGPVVLNPGGSLTSDPDGPIIVINKTLGAVVVSGNAVRVTVDGISRGWVNSGIAPLPVAGAGAGNWQQVALSSYGILDGGAGTTGGGSTQTQTVYTTISLRRGNRRVDLVGPV
ncbi:hypothetical protein Q0M94_03390 [Deinococcus radiomollis]|uniref:hypothetical protein n=1 Tax=Deinococcus radiomollis TaxID=468916 RepID=UPI003892A777